MAFKSGQTSNETRFHSIADAQSRRNYFVSEYGWMIRHVKEPCGRSGKQRLLMLSRGVAALPQYFRNDIFLEEKRAKWIALFKAETATVG